jgi:sortase A
MPRKKYARLIVTLSVISLTAGVAVSAFAGYQIHTSNVAIAKNYIKAAELSWIKQANEDFAIKARVSVGTFLGTINIPAINKTFNIFEGTESKELAKGVGHYVKSVMPGLSDNSVLAGHRDTVFADLGKVKLGALIRIRVREGNFDYKVASIRIVGKNNRTVIVPTSEATLTLSTCYPFTFIGNAPKRYIVTAKLISPLE